jgi:hypothetical protein
MKLDAGPPPSERRRGSNVEPEWPVWRLVMEGVATLTEIEAAWGLGDILDGNEALDAYAVGRRQG